MIRALALAALAGVLALAAVDAPRAQPPGPPSAAPDTLPTLAPPTPVPRPTTQQCDAASLTWLIGKPRTEIPAPIDPSRRRVYCSSCLVTQDYLPDRTDIVFDDRTGIITHVKCG